MLTRASAIYKQGHMKQTVMVAKTNIKVEPFLRYIHFVFVALILDKCFFRASACHETKRLQFPVNGFYFAQDMQKLRLKHTFIFPGFCQANMLNRSQINVSKNSIIHFPKCQNLIKFDILSIISATVGRKDNLHYVSYMFYLYSRKPTV